MKKFTGLVIILIVLVLGSYYGMGYLTEKKVKEDLRIVNQSNGLSVEVEKYKRGWFRSEASLNWRLEIPEHVVTSSTGQPQTVPAENYQLQMPLTISHGPIIFADKTVKFSLGYAHTDLSLPPKLAEQFNNTFTSESTQPKLSLNLFVSYLNNSVLEISMPEFKLISKNGGQLEWLGMTWATSVSSDRNKIEGNITIDGLRFTKDQKKTVMSSITSEYNLHKTLGGIYLGDAGLSFPSLVVANNNQKILELSQFDVHSDTNIEEGLFNSHFKTSLEKLAVNNKTYGPGNLEVAVRNLDADALTRINHQANQMQQSNDQQRQQVLLAILPELPPLLSRGAEFEISELSFAMPEGTIEGNLLVSLPKTKVASLFELVQKIQGNGKLKLPAVVLKNILSQSIQQRAAALQQPPQSIQQGIVQQMQQQVAGQAAATPSEENGGTVQPASVPAATASETNPAETAQQAEALADKRLASMVQAGFLSLKGNDYLIEMSFSQGKLMVNGKPFDPTMVKFQ